MLDLTQIQADYHYEIKFPDGDVNTYDCLNLIDSVRNKINEKIVELRDKIENDDPEILRYYGPKAPMIDDVKEDAVSVFANIDRVNGIIADRYPVMENDAFKEVFEKELTVSQLEQVKNAIKKKLEKLADIDPQKKT